MLEEKLCVGHLAVLSPAMGGQILQAFGLEGRRVTSLTIQFSAGDVTRLEVREQVTDEQTARLLPLLQQFDLVERAPATPAAADPASGADGLRGSPPLSRPAG